MFFSEHGVSFLAVIGALLAMRVSHAKPQPGKDSPFRKAFIQGFRYAMSDLPVRSALLMLSALEFVRFAIFRVFSNFC